MKRLVIVVLLALAVPCLAFGQGQTPPPKPGPEEQKLAPWIGTWTCNGEIEDGKYGWRRG